MTAPPKLPSWLEQVKKYRAHVNDYTPVYRVDDVLAAYEAHERERDKRIERAEKR